MFGGCGSLYDCMRDLPSHSGHFETHVEAASVQPEPRLVHLKQVVDQSLHDILVAFRVAPAVFDLRVQCPTRVDGGCLPAASTLVYVLIYMSGHRCHLPLRRGNDRIQLHRSGEEAARTQGYTEIYRVLQKCMGSKCHVLT